MILDSGLFLEEVRYTYVSFSIDLLSDSYCLSTVE